MMARLGNAVRSLSWIAWAAIVACVIVALWMATPFFVRQLYPEDVATRGQFGDIFGSVNALFSGLALAGVIVAILIQRGQQNSTASAHILALGPPEKVFNELWKPSRGRLGPGAVASCSTTTRRSTSPFR
jgi:hypothetical protein